MLMLTQRQELLYLSHIKWGLNCSTVALLRKRENVDLIVTLVFGDLHLDCIWGWMDKNMSPQYKLEYHCGTYYTIHTMIDDLGLSSICIVLLVGVF